MKHEATRILAERGFRILHVGQTISVDAPRSVWESTFGITFEEAEKTTLKHAPDITMTYLRPKGELVIPAELESAIADVAFAEPPEYFESP